MNGCDREAILWIYGIGLVVGGLAMLAWIIWARRNTKVGGLNGV
jgi:hypothetical protein